MKVYNFSMEHHHVKKQGSVGENHKTHTPDHKHMIEDFKKRFFISTTLTFPVLVLSETIQGFFGYELKFWGSHYLVLAISTFIYAYGGYPFLKGLLSEVKKRLLGMMTLIGLAISVAYFYSLYAVLSQTGMDFFWELSTLIDIMLLGHWLEMKSVMGASRALEEIARLMPSEAHLLTETGDIEDVDVNDLKPGDIVVIKPGEKIPADGTVVEGVTSVNESMLTGESKPVEKTRGNKVIAASINEEGSIRVKIEKSGKDTYLAQMMELVRKAQESRSRAQDLADRAAFYLTIIAIVVGFTTFLSWMVAGKELGFAIERMATVMVITCPHALGLAIPLVVAVSTAISAKSGFIVRNRSAFERAKDLEVVVFDKTGTLTKGEFGVTDITVLNNGIFKEDNEVLSISASLESFSEHPISKAIVQKAKETNIPISKADDFQAIPGKGVKGNVNGKEYKIVSPGYLLEIGKAVKDERIERLAAQGKTIVYVLEKNEVGAAVALADIIREESRKAISNLKSMGIKCMMITGDNHHTAAWVASEIGLDNYYAEVLPHEKAIHIKELRLNGFKVAMVGDGINDAQALVEADLGIAIGAGTDVAIESADIVLVKNNPEDVVKLIKISKSTYRKMVQNLAWATGYNVVAIPLAAGVLYNQGIVLNPAVSAMVMSLSTIIVALNSKGMKIS